MKPLRLAALVLFVPAVVALAACGKGNGVTTGVTAPTPVGPPTPLADIRFVNGAPDLGNVDFYFQASGAASPTAAASTTTSNIAYAVVTPFITESPTAATILVRAAGAGASAPVLDNLTCPIPQMAVNTIYTIVVSGIGAGNHRCVLFQDVVYSGTPPQYRVHDAALGAPSSLAYGTYATGTTPGSNVPYFGAQVAMAGGVDSATPAAYTIVNPSGPIGNTTNPTFAIGPDTGGPTYTATDVLTASHLFLSGGTTQPDTAGTLNYATSSTTTTAGTSLFAIDCTPAAVAAIDGGNSGVQCNAGGGSGPYALIGTFDTL